MSTSGIAAPSSVVREQAAARLAGLATPAGALGRLGELGVWVSACQGVCPPEPVENVRAVVFAGDHGVAAHGVSAYPAEITGLMVATFALGKAGVSALAAAHGVTVRVLDISVTAVPPGLPDDVASHKLGGPSKPIHLEDALTDAECARAFAEGIAIAGEEIAAGAQLLVSGDMGIGNTTPAAALIAAGLGLPATEVVGRGTGVDDDGLALKTSVIQQALDRTRAVHDDGLATLAALGGADFAAMTGFMVGAARAGVPVLLDGVIAVAAALTAERIEPGAAAWFAAGHRSTEPAQALALEKLGLEPLLDLGMRLGEGSGAVAAVPVVRSSVALLRDVALLADLIPPA